MRGKVAIAAWLIASALPAVWLAWQWRSMPQLGFYHDDALYWTGAKSIAEGHGYRIPSLPGEPLQTKYPPLFPALLALAWKFGPPFPANLPFAVLIVWCFYPLVVGLAWLLFGRFRFSGAVRVALTTAVALNPMIVLLSMSLMPEIIFLALLLAALLLAEKHPAMSGLAAGAAFLCKTAALPLLPSVPAYYLLQRNYRAAARFLAIMLPVVTGWQLWVWRHTASSGDLVSLYYTNYAGFEKLNVSLSNFPWVIWRNLDAFLTAIGKLLTFDRATWESRRLEWLLAIAAISGVVRLARRSRHWQYPFFALLLLGMLLIWHYPADERLVLPLYPLLLAGFATELSCLYSAIQHARKREVPGQRIVAQFAAGLMCAVLAFVAAGMLIGDFRFLPETLNSYAEVLRTRLLAYDWLSRNASPASNVFAYDDPLVYLYAGRHAVRLPVPPKLIYEDDRAGVESLMDSFPTFAHNHEIRYVVVTANDLSNTELQWTGASRLIQLVAASPGYERAYQAPGAIIYQESGIAREGPPMRQCDYECVSVPLDPSGAGCSGRFCRE